jgi:hypothetical protein
VVLVPEAAGIAEVADLQVRGVQVVATTKQPAARADATPAAESSNATQRSGRVPRRFSASR